MTKPLPDQAIFDFDPPKRPMTPEEIEGLKLRAELLNRRNHEMECFVAGIEPGLRELFSRFGLEQTADIDGAGAALNRVNAALAELQKD